MRLTGCFLLLGLFATTLVDAAGTLKRTILQDHQDYLAADREIWERLLTDQDSKDISVSMLPPRPTSPPTNEPPLSPVIEPPLSPSTEPSPSPSTEPPLSPSIEPPAPETPVQSPQILPPTGECILNVEADCSLSTGQSCESFEDSDVVITCEEEPVLLGMRYNGGDCDQSYNEQPDKFFCEDFEGGPPVEEGTESYIVVTDASDEGSILQEGFVPVGGYYNITAGASEGVGEERFIYIYSTDSKSESDLLQFVNFDSSCSSSSSSLNLGDIFGASQVVSWINDVQGLVTSFATITYTVALNFPETLEDAENILMETYVLATNFAGTIDISEQISGQILDSGDTISIPIPTQIDLTMRKRYNFSLNLTGIIDTGGEDGGEFCEGSSFESYIIGLPVGETVPTVSPAPTPPLS